MTRGRDEDVEANFRERQCQALERIADAADALTKFIHAVVDIGSEAIVAEARGAAELTGHGALKLVNPVREMFDLEPLK